MAHITPAGSWGTGDRGLLKPGDQEPQRAQLCGRWGWRPAPPRLRSTPSRTARCPGSLRGLQEDGHRRVQAGYASPCQATRPKPQATLSSLSGAWGCVQMAATGRVEHSLAPTLRAGAQPRPQPPWLGSQPVLAGAGGTPGLQGQQCPRQLSDEPSSALCARAHSSGEGEAESPSTS